MSLFFDLHLLEKRESRIFMHSPSFGMLMERNVFSKCFNPMLFSCLLHVVSSFLKNSKFIQSSCSLCSLALNKFYVRLICFPIIFCCIRVPSPIWFLPQLLTFPLQVLYVRKISASSFFQSASVWYTIFGFYHRLNLKIPSIYFFYHTKL